jgi:hypothetical protein
MRDMGPAPPQVHRAQQERYEQEQRDMRDEQEAGGLQQPHAQSSTAVSAAPIEQRVDAMSPVSTLYERPQPMAPIVPSSEYPPEKTPAARL